MLRALERVFVRTNEVLVVGLMMTMTSLVLLNVVTRYGFRFSVTWAEELARFLMIWVAYIGAGLALRNGNHVAFEYVQTLLPPRLTVWLRALVAVGILVFLGFLTYYGWEFSQLTMRQRSAVLGVQRGIVGLAIPIGAAVLGMHLLMTVRQFVMARSPDDESGSDPLASPSAGVAAEPPTGPPAGRPEPRR